MNLLELFSGIGSVGTIAKSLGFNDARKTAVRLAEKWRSGWPKSGGQAGRKVAVRLAEKWRSGWPKSGGQAGRKVAVRLAEKWRSGGQAGRKVAVRRSGWPKSGGQAVMSLISQEDVKEHIKLFIESKKFNVKNTVRDTNIILNMMHERRKIYIQLSSHQLNYYPELKL